MEDKIRELRQKIEQIGLHYVVLQERHIMEEMMEILPQVQEFAVWFLGGNQFGISSEDYQALCENLLSILNDISKAMEQKDKVLMFDSIHFGILEYLKMFAEEETEEDS